MTKEHTMTTYTDDPAKNNGTVLALGELREAVECIHRQTAELAARLGPILRDTDQPILADDSVVAVYHGAYTTQEVRRAIDLVWIVRDDIANIIGRIDL